MASKGQKFKQYPLKTKESIVKRFIDGESGVCLSKEFEISRFTIMTWVKKYRNEGTLAPKKRPGRPKGKTNYKEKYEILKKFQDFLEEVDREKK